MKLYPSFTRCLNNTLVFETKVMPDLGIYNIRGACKDLHVVLKEAGIATKKLGGDPEDRMQLLGQARLQVGRYRGATFRWLVENRLGYVAWMVQSLGQETATTTPLSRNKFLLKEYVELFSEGREALQQKAAETAKSKRPPPSRQPRVPSAVSCPSRAIPSAASTCSGDASVGQLPCLPPTVPPKLLVAPETEVCDADLVQAAEQAEATLASLASSTLASGSRLTQDRTRSATVSLTHLTPEDIALHTAEGTLASSPSAGRGEEQHTATRTRTRTSGHVPLPPPETTHVTPDQPIGIAVPASGQDEFPLPPSWRKTLPETDHRWVSKALFRWSVRGGAPELDPSKLDRLWYHPPQPRTSQPPRPSAYFGRRLLMWMPKRLWQCAFKCPTCPDTRLTSAGLYHTVRKVMDMDGFYSLAAEYLECPKCHRKLNSWSLAILDQLDLGHRNQFPAVLTYKYACDLKVVRSMRRRGLGNGPMQLQNVLQEAHSERWLEQTALYLTDREQFERSGFARSTPEMPPAMPDVPSHEWLLSVYMQDVCQRQSDLQALVTSTFGSILKMDSTKKITRKLRGKSAGTAAWATNIGNEHGQVLMSVLTSHEGSGLDNMLRGLQKRYSDAMVAPPRLLYVDRDCCSSKLSSALRPDWATTRVRLDIWHFMRRLAGGVTTESHQLYPTFMRRISRAIFTWDADDVRMLKTAKRAQLLQRGIANPSDSMVCSRLSRRELALHCRRATRGAEETTRLIDDLFTSFTSEQACDTLGVPLLDADRSWQIWEEQKRHVVCIQDAPDLRLYTMTGYVKKGGMLLPTYRCARGSTSLESFHLHLNRFIPGSSTNDVHYQAYLLEGLARWNQDRGDAAVEGQQRKLVTYSSRLQHGVNELAVAVLKEQVLPEFQLPRPYTGEKFGMDYLLSQHSDSFVKLLDPNDRLKEGAAPEEEEEEEDDEGFQELGGEEEPLDPTIPSLSEEDDIEMPPRQRARPPAVPTVPDVPHVPAERPGPSTSTSSDSQATGVGPDGVPGYPQVHRLALLLVSLRGRPCLTDQDAASVVALYNDLNDYDKASTVFVKRYSEEKRGRFKADKRVSSVSAATQSTRRSILGTNSGPAAHPDCNRVTEAIVQRLLDLHKKDIVRRGKRTTRWAMVLEDYGNIRRLVLSCRTVMEETRLQIPTINTVTLIQWYNRQVRQQEQDILLQGMGSSVPAPPATTPNLPSPLKRPLALEMGDEKRLEVVLPQNTAGTKPEPKHRRLLMKPFAPVVGDPRFMLPSFVLPFHPPSATTLPPALTQRPPLPAPSSTCTSGALAPAPFTVDAATLATALAEAQDMTVSRAARVYRRQRLQNLQEGKIKKIYKKHKESITCSKCGQDRLPATHKHYYGYWWCEQTSDLPYEQWLQQKKDARARKKASQE